MLRQPWRCCNVCMAILQLPLRACPTRARVSCSSTHPPAPGAPAQHQQQQTAWLVRPSCRSKQCHQHNACRARQVPPCRLHHVATCCVATSSAELIAAALPSSSGASSASVLLGAVRVRTALDAAVTMPPSHATSAAWMVATSAAYACTEQRGVRGCCVSSAGCRHARTPQPHSRQRTCSTPAGAAVGFFSTGTGDGAARCLASASASIACAR